MPFETKVAKKLIKRAVSLSIAESCTGGLLSHLLTNASGSSKYLKISIVTYSNESKIKILKIDKTLIQKFGAVSQEVTTQMAQNARKLFKTDFSISITGIAGPTGATKTKPLGLTYISVATPTKTSCHQFIFKGNRLDVKTQAANEALKLLFSVL